MAVGWVEMKANASVEMLVGRMVDEWAVELAVDWVEMLAVSLAVSMADLTVVNWGGLSVGR